MIFPKIYNRSIRLKLYELQGRKCACCGKFFPLIDPNVIYIGEPSVPLYLDHDHKDGSVRGMVCPKCNLLIGKVEAGKVASSQVEQYLQESKERMKPYVEGFF